MEVPRDLLPGTGQQRINPFAFAGSYCQPPPAIVKGASRNCHFFVTRGSPGWVGRSLGLAPSVVHSSDYPEVAEDSRARTYFGDPVACSRLEDALRPNLGHPGKR